jgi:hypothetical protein
MNRVLKRPMFRMGGFTGTGITSGLPRASYAEGPGPEGVKSTIERLQEAAGPAREFGIEDFLIPFGLNFASATPRGKGFSGLVATAAGAAKEPAADLMAARKAEKDFQRKLRLEAAGIDIDAEKKAEANALERIGLKGAVDMDLLKERDKLEKENIELQGKIGSEQIILKNKEKIKAIEFEIKEKSKYPEIFGKSDSAFAVQTPEAVKGKYMDSFIAQGGIFEDKSIELSNAYYNVLNNPNIDQATKNNFKDLTYTAKYDSRTKQTNYTPNLGTVSVGAIVYDATKGIYVQRVQKSDDPRKDFIALDYTTLKPLETGE